MNQLIKDKLKEFNKKISEHIHIGYCEECGLGDLDSEISILIKSWLTSAFEEVRKETIKEIVRNKEIKELPNYWDIVSIILGE